MDIRRARLETSLQEVEGIADNNAHGAGDVAGPEVGGHCRSPM